MHWLYLLASLVCLGLAMVRSMPTIGVLFFLACSLGLMVAWILGWMSSRISSTTRDIGHIMSPEELPGREPCTCSFSCSSARWPAGWPAW